MFFDEASLRRSSWQAFERLVQRLLTLNGFDGARAVGQSHDGGADVIAHKGGKRWLFQVKRWKRPVSMTTIDETLRALRLYRAEVPVVVSPAGFARDVEHHRQVLHSEGVPLQLWDARKLVALGHKAQLPAALYTPRPYQEEAIQLLTRAVSDPHTDKALIVLATGLGKTFVAAETIARVRTQRPQRVLAIAHTNPLVYQLERAFWPTLTPRSFDDRLEWTRTSE